MCWALLTCVCAGLYERWKDKSKAQIQREGEDEDKSAYQALPDPRGRKCVCTPIHLLYVSAKEPCIYTKEPNESAKECLPSTSWFSWSQASLHPYTIAQYFFKRALYLHKRALCIRQKVPTKLFLTLVAASTFASLHICHIFLKEPYIYTKEPYASAKALIKREVVDERTSASQSSITSDTRGRNHVCVLIHPQKSTTHP